MRNVRKVGFLCVVLAVVGMSGCGTDPAGRVELYRNQLVKLESALAASDAKIEALTAALEQGGALLTDPNVADPNERQAIATKLDQVKTALAAAQVRKSELQAWVASTRQAIDQAQAAGGIDLSGELGLIGGAVSQGGNSVGGKTGAYIGLAGLAISLLGNALQKRKTDTLTAATKAIVKGVEAAPADAAEQVKAQIGEKMKAAGVFDAANAIVDAIKG